VSTPREEGTSSSQQKSTTESNPPRPKSPTPEEHNELSKKNLDEGATAPTAPITTKATSSPAVSLNNAESNNPSPTSLSATNTTQEGVVISDEIKDQLFLFGDAPASPPPKSERTVVILALRERERDSLTTHTHITLTHTPFCYFDECQLDVNNFVLFLAKNILSPPLSPSTKQNRKRYDSSSLGGFGELPPEWDDPEKVNQFPFFLSFKRLTSQHSSEFSFIIQ
jgi:hypothetical protein